MSDLLTFEQSEMLKKVKENSIEYASLSDNEKEIFKFLKTYQYVKFTGKSNDIYSGAYTGRKTHPDKVLITMQGKQYLAYEERFIESESRAVEAQKEAKIARYIAIASLSLSVLQFLINDLMPLLK